MNDFKKVDFFAQNELFWSWADLNAHPGVITVKEAVVKQVAAFPVLAEIDHATVLPFALTFSTILFSSLGAKKVLQKMPIEVRFFGTWLGVMISNLAIDLLTGQSPSIFTQQKPFLLFLLAFFLVEFPVTSFFLQSAPFKLAINLLHGVNKTTGMLDTAVKAATLYPQNPI